MLTMMNLLCTHTQICSTCKKTINWALEKSSTYKHFCGGCGPPVQWAEHDDENCLACELLINSKKGGRPPKKKRTTVPPTRTMNTTDTMSHTFTSTTSVSSDQQHASTQPSDESTSDGQDITLQDLERVATPPYRATKDWAPERFVVNLPSLICSIRNNVAERAVEARCCEQTYCAACMWQWLGVKATCAVCRTSLCASQLVQSSNRKCLQLVAETIVHCDNFSNEFNGCPATIRLDELKTHMATCTNTGKHTISPSTPVSAILTASPRKLQGDISEKLTGHLVKTKSVGGVLEIRSKGPSQTWTKTTMPKVPSDQSSERTGRRRSAVLEQSQRMIFWWCC